jgi:hypothetical protein
MKHTPQSLLRYVPATFWLLCACANIGNPNGGPYDEDPPKFTGSRPAMNELNFKGKRIEVFFDEYIALESPSENVIVTPPQKQNPFIQAVGKRIVVELKDTLKEQTTYTIDFTSSITDNNEKNALENFGFAFSTGDVLDTLQISGVVLQAKDLEPVQRMLVGIHGNLSDTAFTMTPFLRTSKTDERGRFVIHNVAPGAYHLFALEDKNRNYAYDKYGDEALAFLDSIVVPTCERKLLPDTVWRDSTAYDTVRMIEKTVFYPNDLKLRFFKDSIAPRQRMLRPERPQDYLFTLKFNAPVDTLPDPVPLNFALRDSLWYVTQCEESPEGFSINYWMLDSAVYKIDTLQVGVSYWKHNDSIPDLVERQTDTLTLVNREAAAQKKKKPARRKPARVRPNVEASGDSLNTGAEKPPAVPLQVAVMPSGSLNPYDIISVKFNEPVMDVRKDFFVLEQGVDTLWQPVDFEFRADPVLAMTYNLVRPFHYEERFRLTIDSAALCGVYGHCNDPLSVALTVKGEKEYGCLIVTIQGLPEAETAADADSLFEAADAPTAADADSLFATAADAPTAADADSLFATAADAPTAADADSLFATADAPTAADADSILATADAPMAADADSLFAPPSVVADSLLATAAADADSLLATATDASPTGKNAMPAFMELLNGNGSPVAKAIVENGVATFRDMTPEKYYARLILDANGNGLWDAGNYEEKRQPEQVVYLMIQLEVRQNWTIEETWDISRSQSGEKPYELLQNKPKEDRKKKRNYKEESKPGQGGSSSSNIRGLGGLGF